MGFRRCRDRTLAVARAKLAGKVEKVVRIFDSAAEADEADALSDAELSPDERVAIVIELRERCHPDASQQGLARVSRIVELERS